MKTAPVSSLSPGAMWGAPRRISRSFSVASAIWLSLWARAQSDQNPGVGSRNSFTVATRWYCLMLRHQAESIPMNIGCSVNNLFIWDDMGSVSGSWFYFHVWHVVRGESATPRHGWIQGHRSVATNRIRDDILTSQEKPWQAMTSHWFWLHITLLHHVTSY